MKRPLFGQELRAQRLQKALTWSSWWIMAQGLLYVLTGPRLSAWLSLRFMDAMAPYMNQAGIALLCLGLFVNRAVREASKQYLAVDTLVLFFCARVVVMLNQRLHGYDLTLFEWLGIPVDAGFAAALIVFRTRGSQMEAPGTLVAMDAQLAARQALDTLQGLAARVGGKASKPAPSLPTSPAVAPEVAAPPVPKVPMAVPVEVPIAVPVAEAPQGAIDVPPPPKPISTAIPHMD